MNLVTPYGDDLLPLLAEATARTALQCLMALGISLTLGGLVTAFWHYSRSLVSAGIEVIVGLLEAMGPILPSLAILMALQINSDWAVASILGSMTWASLAVLLRDEAARVSRLAHVEAAIVAGASPIRLLWHHILPHLMARLWPALVALFSSYAGLLGALGFLGISGNARHSIGFMIYDAKSYIRQAPSYFIGSFVCLLLLVLLPRICGMFLPSFKLSMTGRRARKIS